MYSTVFSVLHLFSAYRTFQLLTDAFELWYWRRLLRVPWIARRYNQSILKEINPEYSLEGPLQKLHYFDTWCEEPGSFPCNSISKESACNTGDLGLIPGLGRSPGNPLQYSCLENPLDRGAWRAIVHRVTRVGHNLAIKPPPQEEPTHWKRLWCWEWLKGKGEGGGIGWDG